MSFKDKPFEKSAYAEQEQKPKRVIIISCEGQNTEPQYFETIKYKLSDYISV